MHIVTLPREETVTVKFNGKVLQVTMGGDSAFVPGDLGEFMVAKGLVGNRTNTTRNQNGKNAVMAGVT